jgi:arylsulfatase A-like enzyme
MDLACQGSKFYETPNIDRLASQGMRFTNAYAACPVCSPTRASVMTGRYPARLHLTDWIAGHNRPNAKLRIPDWTMYLPLEEVTIAEALKPAGYATASMGKWHLGGPEYWPEKQGFDVNFAGTNQGQPPSYFAPYKIQTVPSAPDGEYLTDRLAEEACKFIDASKDRPFFLYLPHYAVHSPLMAKKEMIVKPGTTSDEVVISVDFFPTILEMAGVAYEPGPKHALDGISFVQVLKQAGRLTREAIYWHYPHYHNTTPGGIIRAGDWKLIEYFEDGRVELYNLREDLSETKDLAATSPEKAAELRKKLADWRTSVGAQMPTPNPDYDPAKGKSDPAGKQKAKAKKAAANQAATHEQQVANLELMSE